MKNGLLWFMMLLPVHGIRWIISPGLTQNSGIWGCLLLEFALLWILVEIIDSDISTHRIPDRWNIRLVGILMLRIILITVNSSEASLRELQFSLEGGAEAFLLAQISSICLRGRGFGGGDRKMMILIGLALGPSETLRSILIACFAALPEAFAQGGLCVKGQGKDREFAFGPYLALALWVGIERGVICIPG